MSCSSELSNPREVVGTPTFVATQSEVRVAGAPLTLQLASGVQAVLLALCCEPGSLRRLWVDGVRNALQSVLQ